MSNSPQSQDELDEILVTLVEDCHGIVMEQFMSVIDKNPAFDRAKQKLLAWRRTTSLDEKVLPNDFVRDGAEPDACLNHTEYTGACCACQKRKERNRTIAEIRENIDLTKKNIEGLE